MRVEFVPERIKQTSRRKYATRFMFGGTITAIAGFLAHQYGPSLGGLFLAFPAILPAAVTLIEEEEGKAAAKADAAGAAVGSMGMLAFGAVVWVLAPRTEAWLCLTDALVVWLVVSVGLWTALQLLASAITKENLRRLIGSKLD